MYHINSLPFHFTSIRPTIPEIELFQNLTLKHPRSRSWVRSKVKVTYCTQYPTNALPFRFTSIDQSHRYGRHQAACRKPEGSYDKTTQTAICFEHKAQYLLIRAPYTRIVAFWHISNIPPMISQSETSCNTLMLYIATIFVRYCYTTGSWLL